jgi:hypothetical protein
VLALSPKLRSLIGRIILVGGVALVGTFVARDVPRSQTLAIRLGSREVKHIEGVVTRQGDSEPTAGFSQDFSGGSPSYVRHELSAANGTYIVVITFTESRLEATPSAPGDMRPTLTETSFERRVSLTGGEVIVSPD